MQRELGMLKGYKGDKRGRKREIERVEEGREGERDRKLPLPKNGGEKGATGQGKLASVSRESLGLGGACLLMGQGTDRKGQDNHDRSKLKIY